jgi:hypothetical protein
MFQSIKYLGHINHACPISGMSDIKSDILGHTFGPKDIQHEFPIHYGHLKKNRSLDPRVPILWPSENLRKKRCDQDFSYVLFFGSEFF